MLFRSIAAYAIPGFLFAILLASCAAPGGRDSLGNRPGPRGFTTVIIDAGHGGKDPGATNALGTEAAYNLQVSQSLKKMLTERGYKVLMTRDTNRYLTLQERVDFVLREDFGGYAFEVVLAA
mgnify:CR=1 FL=1